MVRRHVAAKRVDSCNYTQRLTCAHAALHTADDVSPLVLYQRNAFETTVNIIKCSEKLRENAIDYPHTRTYSHHSRKFADCTQLIDHNLIYEAADLGGSFYRGKHDAAATYE